MTICTHDQGTVFGNVSDGKVDLSEIGKIVESVWMEIPNRFLSVELDLHVFMPNHFHGIIFLDGLDSGRASSTPTTPTPTFTRDVGGKMRGLVFDVIRVFKSASTVSVNKQMKTLGKLLWQRNYFERVIRNDTELEKIREYIANNPLKWELERNEPENLELLF